MPQPDATHHGRVRGAKQYRELAPQARYGPGCDHTPENKDRHVFAPVHNRQARTLDRSPPPDPAAVQFREYPWKSESFAAPIAFRRASNDRTLLGSLSEVFQWQFSPPVRASLEA